jgi:hypothetical protein
MSKPKLKLVKAYKRGAKLAGKASGRRKRTFFISGRPTPSRPDTQTITLTPAEKAEAARFRAYTEERAARQATVRRIVAKLQETDDPPTAA